MYGEGDYNLNVVKEMKVTNALLKLPLRDRSCQNIEPIENCTTRILIDKMNTDCRCLPLSIRVGNQVQ